MLLLLLLLQQLDVQGRIDALVAERAQLVALIRDCAPAGKDPAIADLQARIAKLTALKAEPEATADIDVLLDELIARVRAELDNLDPAKTGDCFKEKAATARIAEINAQVAKLEILKGK